MEHVVIIGNGIAGITAARHIRKLSDKKITVISAETDFFFSRTALMYIYMGHMKFEHTKPYEDWFWEKNKIGLLKAYVQTIDTQNKQLKLDNGTGLSYDKLILAVGSKPNKFGWPGQNLKAVQGLYSYQDLESMEEYSPTTKRAVIIGGGLIGVEMAEMFLSRGIAVTFLVREDRFWGGVLPKREGDLISRHIKKHGVDLRFNIELKEILPDENGRARAIITTNNEEIECQFVGLTAGVSPNISFMKEGNIETNRGVLVNEYLETNIPNIYALGDCAEFHQHPTGRKNLEQVWYTGRMMGETLAQTICGNKTAYKPGVWFNSAKFFDIEYQTYGWVNSELRENEADFYWEHEKGEICLHLVFDKASNKLLGVNTFGIRLRHEVCEKWINGEATIEYALEHLKDANFDAEFYKQYEKEIINQYNQEKGTNLKVRKRDWKRIFSKN
ncbi:MAG: NAD(P)/FAD-dependent oxidoreductase [Flavobacteriales bacterium]|nr:NAD(P)/FAD-dependent oxidoreductase [Flavobacteriales bacterium]